MAGGKHGKAGGQVGGPGSKAPIAQSHQRQLSLKADEIQERLIKNKTLLNVVEPPQEGSRLTVFAVLVKDKYPLQGQSGGHVGNGHGAGSVLRGRPSAQLFIV